jgi:hypothetical protein
LWSGWNRRKWSYVKYNSLTSYKSRVVVEEEHPDLQDQEEMVVVVMVIENVQVLLSLLLVEVQELQTLVVEVERLEIQHKDLQAVQE